MLRRYLAGRRQSRHRFDAAPSLARQQAGAIVVQRRHPTDMTDHARQFADISRKALDLTVDRREIHPRSSAQMNFRNYLILN
jgi:TfoX/Sxy family transcriptional regulator of competence genes